MSATPPNSFERRFRLTSKAQYQQVFKTPQVSQDRCFRVLAKLNELDYPRLGMAVSTRVSKSAVERNRLKRLVRESFRQHRQLLAEQGPGLDFVVLPGPASIRVSNTDLRASLKQHWQKLPARINRMAKGPAQSRGQETEA
jgi:ribonuclease P protein component